MLAKYGAGTLETCSFPLSLMSVPPLLPRVPSECGAASPQIQVTTIPQLSEHVERTEGGCVSLASPALLPAKPSRGPPNPLASPELGQCSVCGAEV